MAYCQWRTDRVNENFLVDNKFIELPPYNMLRPMTRQEIETLLTNAGFTNIELIDLEDAGIAFWLDGKVKTISVGSNTAFGSDDWFTPDTKVIISYH